MPREKSLEQARLEELGSNPRGENPTVYSTKDKSGTRERRKIDPKAKEFGKWEREQRKNADWEKSPYGTAQKK